MFRACASNSQRKLLKRRGQERVAEIPKLGTQQANCPMAVSTTLNEFRGVNVRNFKRREESRRGIRAARRTSERSQQRMGRPGSRAQEYSRGAPLVWESGPAVVSWNIAIRIVVAALPVAIGIVGRFIIDGVNRSDCTSRCLNTSGGWSARRLALAVLSGVLSRAVDYFDNLLADRYTHHVSVEVMRKAASLDVTVYEDPVSTIAWSALVCRLLTGWP